MDSWKFNWQRSYSRCFKAYRKACFKQMGGLKAGMGHRGRIVVYILWMESSHWRYTNCQALKPTEQIIIKPLVTNKVKLYTLAMDLSLQQ
jgi:hypothetical protein